ncbi:MAG: thiamine-phosphate kinase, partial [Pseudomonadota bacterium]
MDGERTLAEIGELGVVDLVRKSAHRPKNKDLVRGIGEDCAVISFDKTYLLVTTDALVENVHFSLNYTTPYLLGKKSVAVNLSDIAAMGGRPRYVFLTLAAPGQLTVSFARQFLRGMNYWSRRFDLLLAGGDTVHSPSGLVLNITVIGQGQKDSTVFRSGAKEGDLIFVSGYLGDSAAGLELLQRGYSKNGAYGRLVKAHLDPVPQLPLGQYLSQNHLASAMIDLSDGLATDLAHIGEESGIGAEVYADRIPTSRACRKFSEVSGSSPTAWALTGGEDYGLLFTVPAKKAEELK